MEAAQDSTDQGKDTSWSALSPTAVQLSPPASGAFIQSSHIFNITYSGDTHTLFSVFQVHLHTYALRIYSRMEVTALLSERMQQIKSPGLHLSIMFIQPKTKPQNQANLLAERYKESTQLL